MAKLSIEDLRVHRPWEDWLGMGLGALVVFSPWALAAEDLAITLNALAIGVMIYSVSALELKLVEVWEDWLNLSLGLWLVSAPWTLGYSDQSALAAAHHTLGALVVALATLQLWQDLRPARRTVSK